MYRPGPTVSPLARIVLAVLLLPTLAIAQMQTNLLDPANLDTTCAPCQDFYRYANGGGIDRSSIRGDQPAVGKLLRASGPELRQPPRGARRGRRAGEDHYRPGWAQIWRSKQRPQYARLLVTVDVHALMPSVSTVR